MFAFRYIQSKWHVPSKDYGPSSVTSTTLVGLRAGGQRPHAGQVVVDEGLMLPEQREAVLVGDGVYCVALSQPLSF